MIRRKTGSMRKGEERDVGSMRRDKERRVEGREASKSYQ